ncbi:hypothetical protein V6R21_24880 [Limibacter armeniacum]|uniref:hypothetical protein n=1 Tax=Limibacter armeniacum TaxID=466084 RepID=UPI002FE5B002
MNTTTINQISKILALDEYGFDILADLQGERKLLYENIKKHDASDIAHFLRNIANSFELDQLHIQRRKKNGSSAKLLDYYTTIRLSETEYPGLSGVAVTAPPAAPVAHPGMDDYKNFVINRLERENNSLQSKLEYLEKENQELRKDNFNLEKQSAFKDKEFELIQRQVELEKSGGMNGVLEKVAANPVLAGLAGTALARIMGIDQSPHATLPMTMNGEQDEMPHVKMEGADESVAAEVGEKVKEWLKTQTEEVVSKYYVLTQIIGANPSVLDKILSKFKVNHEGKSNHYPGGEEPGRGAAES